MILLTPDEINSRERIPEDSKKGYEESIKIGKNAFTVNFPSFLVIYEKKNGILIAETKTAETHPITERNKDDEMKRLMKENEEHVFFFYDDTGPNTSTTVQYVKALKQKKRN